MKIPVASLRLGALLSALAISACTSSAQIVAHDPYFEADAQVTNEALAKRCAFKVGSAHPRGVVVPGAFQRCMQRQETLRIREQLRAMEKHR